MLLGRNMGNERFGCFYVLKEQQLSPEFQQIGNETLVIINNVSYQNVRWEICVFAFSSFKLYDVQFIKIILEKVMLLKTIWS